MAKTRKKSSARATAAKTKRPNKGDGQQSLHDAIFKDTFRNTRYCLDIFRLVFSKVEFALFNWKTLSCEITTFVNKNMREVRSDLIFSVRQKGSQVESRIMLLLEHKSYQSPDFLQQILEYQCEMYRKMHTDKKLKQGRMSPIIPILVYHGKRKKWASGLSYQDILDNKSPTLLRKFGGNIINFNCRIINLSDISERKISRLISAPVFYIMANIWDVNPKKIEKVLTLLQKLNKKDRIALLKNIVNYIRRYDEKFTWKILDKIESKVVPEEDKIMGVIRKLSDYDKEEGRKEGREEGKQEKAETIARNLLREGVDTETIVKTTGLSVDELEKLKASA